jgi:alpha-tubulin suppressor-like RCC1 family protein
MHGNIGNGSTGGDNFTPFLVFPSGVRTCVCGGNFSVALLESGQLYSWGYNGAGQLGVGHSITSSSPEPIKFPTISKESSQISENYENSEISGYSPLIKALACGGNATSILTEEGIMWSWGRRGHGQATWTLQFRQEEPIKHPEMKWKVPVQWTWDSVFRWLWLGRLEGPQVGSGFKQLPVEVLFNMVCILGTNPFF